MRRAVRRGGRLAAIVLCVAGRRPGTAVPAAPQSTTTPRRTSVDRVVTAAHPGPSAALPVRRLLLVLLTAIALIASGGTPVAFASGPLRTVHAADYRTYQQEPIYVRYQFASPSGNLRCQIARYEDSAPWGCVAVGHSWKDPVLPDYYRGGCAKADRRLSGAMLAPFPGAGFAAMCTGYLPDAKKRGRTLPFDRRIVAGGIACTSLRVRGEETLRCTGPKKASFSMSRTKLTFRQPKGWKG